MQTVVHFLCRLYGWLAGWMGGRLTVNGNRSSFVEMGCVLLSGLWSLRVLDQVLKSQIWDILPFIHSVFCLTTGPKPPPKRFLHIVRSRTSSFKLEYPLPSLRSSSSFLRLLPRLLVTSISPFIFPSITCFRRQFLRKMWPIQLSFRFLISCRIFLCSLTLSNTSSFLTW